MKKSQLEGFNLEKIEERLNGEYVGGLKTDISILRRNNFLIWGALVFFPILYFLVDNAFVDVWFGFLIAMILVWFNMVITSNRRKKWFISKSKEIADKYERYLRKHTQLNRRKK